jgi:hypothetical protein
MWGLIQQTSSASMVLPDRPIPMPSPVPTVRMAEQYVWHETARWGSHKQDTPVVPSGCHCISSIADLWHATVVSGMAQLPSGTVTFLFTDIEGSTALWEHHPDAMPVALAIAPYAVRLSRISSKWP